MSTAESHMAWYYCMRLTSDQRYLSSPVVSPQLPHRLTTALSERCMHYLRFRSINPFTTRQNRQGKNHNGAIGLIPACKRSRTVGLAINAAEFSTRTVNLDCSAEGVALDFFCFVVGILYPVWFPRRHEATRKQFVTITVWTPALCLLDTSDKSFLYVYHIRHSPYARFVRTTSLPYLYRSLSVTLVPLMIPSLLRIR